jgi:hypothetical protein
MRGAESTAGRVRSTMGNGSNAAISYSKNLEKLSYGTTIDRWKLK